MNNVCGVLLATILLVQSIKSMEGEGKVSELNDGITKIKKTVTESEIKFLNFSLAKKIRTLEQKEIEGQLQEPTVQEKTIYYTKTFLGGTLGIVMVAGAIGLAYSLLKN